MAIPFTIEKKKHKHHLVCAIIFFNWANYIICCQRRKSSTVIPFLLRILLSHSSNQSSFLLKVIYLFPSRVYEYQMRRFHQFTTINVEESSYWTYWREWEYERRKRRRLEGMKLGMVRVYCNHMGKKGTKNTRRKGKWKDSEYSRLHYRNTSALPSIFNCDIPFNLSSTITSDNYGMANLELRV